MRVYTPKPTHCNISALTTEGPLEYSRYLAFDLLATLNSSLSREYKAQPRTLEICRSSAGTPGLLDPVRNQIGSGAQ